MASLLETTNSFGRQHHLNSQRSEPKTVAALGGDILGTQHAFPVPPLEDMPHLDSDYAAGTVQSVDTSGFWFDAEACSRCGQRVASPACSSRAASETWHDAVSDLATSTCGSDVPDCSDVLLDGRRKQGLRDSVGSACSLDTAISGALRQTSLEQDTQRRQAEEWAACQQAAQAQLHDMREAHRKELEASWQLTEEARGCARQARQQAQSAAAVAAAAAAEAESAAEAQAAAARLAASVFGRILGHAEADEELTVLRKRVEQLCGINSAMGHQPCWCSADAHDSLQRQVMHAGMAVGCATLGLVGAYLLTRRAR